MDRADKAQPLSEQLQIAQPATDRGQRTTHYYALGQRFEKIVAKNIVLSKISIDDSMLYAPIFLYRYEI